LTRLGDIEHLIRDLVSGNDERAERSVSMLAAWGEPALAEILSLLEGDHPDHRWWAVRALAAFDHPEAQRALCRALAVDEPPEIRLCAAMGLRQRPFPAALPPLIAALAEPDRLLARLAADALAAMGKRAIPALHKASQSDNPAVRIEAVRAMAAVRDPEAIEPLLAAIDDPSSIVAYWAEKGLDDLGVGMVFFNP
jgi:HEAT repeat protein